MAEVTEVKALEKISSEVDESQMKVILSTQCIKAQTLLADKLKKRIQQHKETCGYISSANLKLQSEILEAEQKINSMLIAQETIKMANVELRKELLLAKEKKIDIIDRIEAGEKKYEALWQDSKKRYESLQFVKVLLEAIEKADNLKKDFSKLENTSLKLVEEIDNKTETCSNIDKKRIIDTAHFIVNEVPKSIKIIDEKTRLINELTDKLKAFEINKDLEKSKEQEKVDATNKADLSINNDDDLLFMPKLELPSLDYDMLSIKLDQVKLKNANTYKSINEDRDEKEAEIPKTRFEFNMFRNNSTNDLMSSYFTKPNNYEVVDNENYSKRKLINILQDIKVDKVEAMSMMSKVNPEALQPVETIGVESKDTDVKMDSSKLSVGNKGKEPIQSEEIEEIDLTSKEDNIIFPPTQFLDVTTVEENPINENEDTNADVQLDQKGKETSQTVLSQTKEESVKRVSFDLNVHMETDPANEDGNGDGGHNDEDRGQNESAISDDGFAKIKDMMLKKHNLDLSPQFVYAKNNKLQKITEDKIIVTSKFFERVENKVNDNNVIDNEKEPIEQASGADNPVENDTDTEIKHASKKVIEFEVNDDVASSPKRQKLMELPQSIKPVSGLLFSHGAHAIPDSLNVSISTTGFEDGDADFPHCIDSSLLLSPKADIPMSGDNPEVLSQDVPNFLSGLRKTGLSFFGQLNSSESKTDSNSPNPGTSSGFSFNFGGEDKKNRGGLFSMFK